MVCRLGYEISVEITHLHRYDIIYVKTHTCCLELFHRAVVGLRRTSWTVRGAGVSVQCWKDLELATWEPGPDYPPQSPVDDFSLVVTH